MIREKTVCYLEKVTLIIIIIREKTVCYLEKVTLIFINSIKNCHTFCPLSCSQ